MKISWLKYENDKDSFKLPEALGLDVYKIQDLENTDEKIEELINNDYKTIIISNDVASFSENIIKKYNKNPNIKIVISIDKDIL
jgi:vacuolar-type H+-ATPase subunit F/Vma7